MNPDFKRDVDGWLPEQGATMAWDEQNATTDLPSGSALITASGTVDPNALGSALRAASQCLNVTGQQLVTVYANAFIDRTEDSNGHAEVDVFFFDSADCSGEFGISFSTPQPLDAAVDTWLDLKAGAVSGASTRSVLVKLAISRPFRAPSFGARFDNVLLKAQALPP